MTSSIQPVLPLAPAAAAPRSGAAGAGGQFQDVLATAIRQVEQAGSAASAGVQRFLSGEGEELHTAVLAAQRAELTFDLFLQARNKVVQAYQEIMRMQM
jgi:flagellar hook-basal body complex protein FliE